MPINAHIFRIFIASSSDLVKERATVRDVIQEWNSVFGYRNQMYLEPVLFESHIWYDSNQQAQDLINKELVDSCDMMVSLFWKRIGTPTQNSIGGTVEELEKFSKENKPTLLCFKNSELNFDDLQEFGEDLKKIAELKKQYAPRLKIEFERQGELREILYKQISHFADNFKKTLDEKKKFSLKKDKSIQDSTYCPNDDSERLRIQAEVNRDGDNLILKDLIKNIYEKKGAPLRVLDFGCGNGIVGVDRFNNIPEVGEVVGLDSREASISLAKGISKAGNKFKFLVGDIFKLKEDIGTFDLIFVAQVLHHVENPKKICQILWDVLNSNGALFARNSDDALDITYPTTRDMDFILDISPRLKGTSDRFYGRKMYGDLSCLNPTPSSIDMNFNVLHTGEKNEADRGEYFVENHGWRANYAKQLSENENGEGPNTLLYKDMDLAMTREYERYKRDDMIFGMAVQILGFAIKE
ncbi:MAG: methyltransferase domain-containing protein [Alphaproteobacteria bacterium]